ncbi:MAG TPA: polysaccharide deacetylase family protein [Candidatus Paceibacterota bacterium]|nr:polysaccharide deacetylase family protein [Candidatus Paceibacterota bacterium]
MQFAIRERLINLTRTAVGFVYVLSGKPFLHQGMTVFVFHEVNDNPRLHARETNTYSDVELFKKQMGWIKESFPLLNPGDGRGAMPQQGCLITFDDGYSGVLSNAVPILEHYQIPAVCFVNIATIQGDINSSAMTMYMAKRDQNPLHWADSNPQFLKESLAHLSVKEIEEVRQYQGPYINGEELELLSQNPLITIGDHLNNHWYINSLGIDELDIEIAAGRSKLQNYTWDGRFFASPHGVTSDLAIQSIERAGYSYIFSGKSAITTKELSRIYPRIDMNLRIRSRYQLFGSIGIAKMRSIRIFRSLRKIGL